MNIKIPHEVIFDILHDLTREKNWEDRLDEYAEQWAQYNEAFDEGDPRERDYRLDQRADGIFLAEKRIAEHLSPLGYHVEVDHPLAGKLVLDHAGRQWRMDKPALTWVTDGAPWEGWDIAVTDETTGERKFYPAAYVFEEVRG